MKLALVGDLSGFAAGSDRMDGAYDVASLASALARRGHDIKIYTASPNTQQATMGEVAGDFAVAPIPMDHGGLTSAEMVMASISEVGRYLLSAWITDPPDLVHCHGWTYGMAAQLAARRNPVPTVQAFHGLAASARRHRGARFASDTAVKIESLLVRNATMVTAASSDDLREVIRMGCPRARAAVLPSGINVDEFDIAGTSASRDTARRRIVAVARDFSPHQGFANVIRVLPALPAAELVLVATHAPDDKEARRAFDLPQRLGVHGRVHFVTTEDERAVAETVRSADVVVCPAPYDPHAESALRAMACGAAVVAIDSGAPADVVIGEVTGVLVPPGSADALHRALRSVLSHTVLRQGMGFAGRARARSRYSWDRIATDAEGVYQAAAQTAPPLVGAVKK